MSLRPSDPFRTAVFAGTFDPVTLGHLDVIRRGCLLFERLIVGIGIHPTKTSLFSIEERIELLKLNIRVAKSTMQRYLRGARPPRRSGQTWNTFLRNHGKDIWAADFLPVIDLLFRHVYAFFIIEIASRRVAHVGITRHPTDTRSPSNCVRPRHSANTRSSASSILTANTGRYLRVSPRQRASTSCARRTAHQRKMRLVSASWAR